jgi:hypothetical protein
VLRAVGQYPLSSLYTATTVTAGAAVSLTNVTTANITSKSLAAGTYLIWATGDFTLAAATVTQFQLGLSVTTATLPTQAGGSGVGLDPLMTLPIALAAVSATYSGVVGPTNLVIAATTTLFLVTQVAFSAGTVSAYGTLFTLQLNVA